MKTISASDVIKLTSGRYRTLAVPLVEVPAAKPQIAPTLQKPAIPQPAPAKPQLNEAQRQLIAKFALYDQFKAMAAQFGEPDNSLACQFVERGMTAEQGRKEYANRAAIRGWQAALLRAQQH